MPENAEESTPKSPYDWSEPKSLDTMAEEVDNQDNEAGDDSSASENTASDADPVGDNPDDNEPEKPVSSEKADGAKPGGMKEVEDYLDEELASIVKTMRQEITDLQSKLTQAEAAADEVRTVGRMDKLIQRHGGEYSEVLKDGSSKTKVEGAMKVLAAGFESTGQPVPSEDELFKRAIRQELGDSMVESQKQAFAESVEKRNNQIISRTSGHHPSREGGKPADRAALAVHRMMKERGLLD